MKITNLHEFLYSFFTAHQCDIIENSHGMLSVQLTEEMDKQLMNRPFYWHYIQSTGGTGEPMQLTLITDLNKRTDKSQWIHFGSPLLQKVFKNLTSKNQFVHLFQNINTSQNTALYPWLLVNIKIIYQGRQIKEELFSIGLNLVNGMMKVNMMENLDQYTFSKTISDLCYPLTSTIKIKSGYRRILKVLDDYVEQQNHDWAEESINLLNEEIEMVSHFFDEDTEEKIQRKHEEIDQITLRYTPKILYKAINGGVIYLTDSFH